MKTEKRKAYERPRMEVVELRQQRHIMAGSETQGNRSTMNVVYEEEDL